MKLWLRILVLTVLGVAVYAAPSTRSQASFMQTQRAQRSVYILVNVTPAPVSYRSGGSAQPAIAVAVTTRRTKTAASSGGNLGLNGPLVIGQVQKPVRVEAHVSPDPTATMLYSNVPTVTLTGTAGTTVTQSCAYTITVDTPATTYWTLTDGLSNDFSGSFPGRDLLNNTYSGATPQPNPIAFVVYPDNNNQPAQLTKAYGTATFCVDLSLTIPSAVPGGAYSTNAVYTLSY